MRTALLFRATTVVITSLLLPGALLAEGAVRIMECKVTQTCDSTGLCNSSTDSVVFRMEPLKLNDDGSGSYTLDYNKIRVPMTAPSAAGPFLWSTGQERHTLLASSATHFLWHRLTLDPTPTSIISFLACRIRQ